MTERSKINAAMKRVAPLTEQLARRFDLSLSFSDLDHIEDVHRHYADKRQTILRKYGLAETLKRDDYAKAVMISEAAGMLLREIAPKRMQKRTRKEPR